MVAAMEFGSPLDAVLFAMVVCSLSRVISSYALERELGVGHGFTYPSTALLYTTQSA